MRNKRFVFLDRDGVINHNPTYGDYIKSASEFRFIPGVTKAIAMLTKAGFETAVISNQSGVEKGLFTKKDLKNIDRKIIGGLKGLGGRLSGTYYCTHSSEKNCDCKKPKTGLLKKATKRKRIDHKNSYFVGDTERDIIAGKNFGIKTIAVLSGYYNRKDMMAWQAKPDFIVKDLLTAVKKVILK